MQRGLIFSIVEIFHFLDGVSGFNPSDLTNIILYLSPPLIVESRDGWWLRDSLPSYNLDIQVWGPIYAMWGASQDAGHLNIKLDQYDREPETRDLLVSAIIRLRSQRMKEAIPVRPDDLITYDNGSAQIYHLRLRTPFQR